MKSKGNWTYYGLAGSLSYPSSSCQGSTASNPYHRRLPYFNPLAFRISEMCYPPCPLNPIIVNPPAIQIFPFSPFFGNYWQGSQICPIWLMLCQNISNDSTSALQYSWLQRESLWFLEILEWKFQKNRSFLPTTVQQMQPTLTLH